MSAAENGQLETAMLPQSVIDFRRRQVEAVAGKVAKDFLAEHGSEPLMTADYLVREVAERAVQAALYQNGYAQGVLFETNGHVEAASQTNGAEAITR